MSSDSQTQGSETADSAPPSISTPDMTMSGPEGQLAHRDQFDQSERLRLELHTVTDNVWCMVGNGLSNQTFVEGPDGLIVIDTGESVQEMQDALTAVRQHTDAPVAAVLYSHFHYCNGTTAALEEALSKDTPVWGHPGIVGNLQRMAGEIGPTSARGMVHQFGTNLPASGPDGLVNIGLGRFYRNPDHAPFTPGFVPPTHHIEPQMTASIAGLTVTMSHAPSDADDNVNFWFPELDLCVNNLVWPALFNVYAIRGEEYRDPRILLSGIDEIATFGAEHLVCAHGPPLSGRDEVAAAVADARDAIQYLWDQTVRGMNKGHTLGELISLVQLPERFQRTHFTRQMYGLAEHHVRQIHSGLIGWFDGDEANLVPTPAPERARKLIAGFGGRDEVARQARTALADDDLRWALELASWLVRSDMDDRGRADGGSDDERRLLASVLRPIAQRTTSANLRNWCLTRALELEGSIDLTRHRTHRFGRRQVLAAPPPTFVHALRVTLDPDAAEDLDSHVVWRFDDGATAGLHIRRGVAVPTNGDGLADATMAMSLETWASIVSGGTTVNAAVEAGTVQVDDLTAAAHVLSCFDIRLVD